MKTFVVFCFLMAFVMASQAQKKEATEMSEKELANAEEIGDRDAGKQAEDAPNFLSADLGKSATLMAFYFSGFSERFEQCTWSSLILNLSKICHSVALR